FGNLYHLNAEEEPEHPDYPQDPAFKARFGPRGVLHCHADGNGGQTIVDTGPLTKKRMETIDDEVVEHALRFIDEAHAAEEPFFMWWNTTAMHFRTHVADKHKGKTGQGDYADAMVAHDANVGIMLDKLDELGIADNTIVMYSTDNGPHFNSWPDAGITPFRSEKNTNWEGGWRVTAFFRWPGHTEPGTVRSDFGRDLMRNGAHASDSPENAVRERGIVGLAGDVRPIGSLDRRLQEAARLRGVALEHHDSAAGLVAVAAAGASCL
ncbi:MAG: sulfatase-like hydrolase/transferase, partial [Acidobacteriota bacterium]